MRKYGRIDANQTLIVRDLRKIGATVAITSMVGGGFPDIVVGWRGKNFGFEIKDPSAALSDRRLTKDEKDFHGMWQGQICKVETMEEILLELSL